MGAKKNYPSECKAKVVWRGSEVEMKLTWHDAEEIGFLLMAAHPERDPLTLRFVDLHKMVIDLPNFEDDPKASNEGILEAIQMAWHEACQEDA